MGHEWTEQEQVTAELAELAEAFSRASARVPLDLGDAVVATGYVVLEELIEELTLGGAQCRLCAATVPPPEVHLDWRDHVDGCFAGRLERSLVALISDRNAGAAS